MLDETINSHESFGAIRISKIHGNTRSLFGSSIKHSESLLFTISNCDEKRNLNTNWYYPTDALLEFEISHSQFAQMLLQIGSSPIPITLRKKTIGKIKKCEEPPYTSALKQHSDEFIDHLQTINEKTKTLIDELTNTLNNSKLKKSDKEKLVSIANNILTEIQNNSEYQLDAFHEQMEVTVNECKNELVSFLNNKKQITDVPKFLE